MTTGIGRVCMRWPRNEMPSFSSASRRRASGRRARAPRSSRARGGQVHARCRRPRSSQSDPEQLRQELAHQCRVRRPRARSIFLMLPQDVMSSSIAPVAMASASRCLLSASTTSGALSSVLTNARPSALSLKTTERAERPGRGSLSHGTGIPSSARNRSTKSAFLFATWCREPEPSCSEAPKTFATNRWRSPPSFIMALMSTLHRVDAEARRPTVARPIIR